MNTECPQLYSIFKLTNFQIFKLCIETHHRYFRDWSGHHRPHLWFGCHACCRYPDGDGGAFIPHHCRLRPAWFCLYPLPGQDQFLLCPQRFPDWQYHHEAIQSREFWCARCRYILAEEMGTHGTALYTCDIRTRGTEVYIYESGFCISLARVCLFPKLLLL